MTPTMDTLQQEGHLKPTGACPVGQRRVLTGVRQEGHGCSGCTLDAVGWKGAQPWDLPRARGDVRKRLILWTGQCHPKPLVQCARDSFFREHGPLAEMPGSVVLGVQACLRAGCPYSVASPEPEDQVHLPLQATLQACTGAIWVLNFTDAACVGHVPTPPHLHSACPAASAGLRSDLRRPSSSSAEGHPGAGHRAGNVESTVEGGPGVCPASATT